MSGYPRHRGGGLGPRPNQNYGNPQQQGYPNQPQPPAAPYPGQPMPYAPPPPGQQAQPPPPPYQAGYYPPHQQHAPQYPGHGQAPQPPAVPPPPHQQAMYPTPHQQAYGYAQQQPSPYQNVYPPPSSQQYPPQRPQGQQYPPPMPPGSGASHQQQSHGVPPPPGAHVYPPPSQYEPSTGGAATPPQYNYSSATPPPGQPTRPAYPPTHPQHMADMHQGAFSSFKPSGRKRALLIGINYSGSAELKGCINDVCWMQYLLRTKFHFRPKDFVMLTDKDHGVEGVRSGLPTRDNILQAMTDFVSNVQPGESLFFHFSGHGSQVPDRDGDEEDGMDETILPMDYKSKGHIVDDIMYDILVRRLPAGARLTALLDCCHSGTGLDLPFEHDVIYPGSGSSYAGHSGSSGVNPVLELAGGIIGSFLQGRPQGIMGAVKTFGKPKKPVIKRQPDPNAGEVLLFAGCRDNQKAADTQMGTGSQATGAMTYAFIEAIEHGCSPHQQYTYRKLLEEMRNKLRAKRLSQVPQFSTSHRFDLDNNFVV